MPFLKNTESIKFSKKSAIYQILNFIEYYVKVLIDTEPDVSAILNISITLN